MNVRHPWRGIRPFQRHSLVLLVAGTVYVLIGVAYLSATPTPSRLSALYYALRGPMTYELWGFVFMTVGVLAIISSRWPPVSETWGYQALTGLSAGWAAFYLMGVLFHDSSPSNLSGFLSWGLIGFLWWAVSGLVNPKSLIHLLNENDLLREENARLKKEQEA